MTDAVVSFAIEKLDEFLTKEINVRVGVKEAVEWLKEELAPLLILVKGAEAIQGSLSPIVAEQIILWINSVKDFADDAVIILDRYSVLHKETLSITLGDKVDARQGVLSRMWSFICGSKKGKNLYEIGKEKVKKEKELYKIGKEIESLKERVVRIKARQDEYRINDILATPVVQQRKRTSLRATSFQNKEDVVGFEDNVKKLLAQLGGSADTSLGMISIHGMGGLGKSTLASELYHSIELRHIQCRAWVCVSEDYNIEDVLRKIIKSFVGLDGIPGNLLDFKDVDLLRYLKELLQKQDCYLAVIDDMWDINVWKKIKKAFPDKKGATVIITTRNKEVAMGVDDRCIVHELRHLSRDDSWQLFCKVANPTPNLEKLGAEMVDRCDGLPLAIVVLSGLLFHKKSYNDWSNVKEHLWNKLTGESLEIEEILSLSYEELPSQIRPCFLYVARFPEDYAFGVDELKRLWIAEEFISEADEGDGVTMEDVAEDYLNELINRNVIQIEKMQWNEEVLKCRVHDIMRVLAIQKAKKCKLMEIFDLNKQHPSLNHLLQRQPRHAIHNGIGEYLKLLAPSPNDVKLRSLAVIQESGSPELKEIKMMYTRFIYLKVLDLRGVISDMVPKEIGDLVLLKFFGLMGGDNKKRLVIPSTIGKLTKLQTLCDGTFLGLMHNISRKLVIDDVQLETPQSLSNLSPSSLSPEFASPPTIFEYASRPYPVYKVNSTSSQLSSCEFEIPTEIYKLQELRHLDLVQIGGNLNIGKHQTKLQTLGKICFKDWIQIDTVNLTNIRTLYIEDISEEGNGYSLDSIAMLANLQTFIIDIKSGFVPTMRPLSSCERLKNVWVSGRIKDPSDLIFLPLSVTKLVLFDSCFKEDPMPILGSLPNLTTLIVARLYMGKKMVCSSDAFPSLQNFELCNLPNLEEWQVEDGALSSLKNFQIIHCKKLKMPQQLKYAPSIPEKMNLETGISSCVIC